MRKRTEDDGGDLQDKGRRWREIKERGNTKGRGKRKRKRGVRG